MDQEQDNRQELYKALKDNTLFQELIQFLHEQQLLNQKIRQGDLSQFHVGGILMREQAIGAENQVDSILDFIDDLKN